VNALTAVVMVILSSRQGRQTKCLAICSVKEPQRAIINSHLLMHSLILHYGKILQAIKTYDL